MNQNIFLKKLEGKDLIVLSPHCDDAVLSTGMLMLALRATNKITVINIFTAAHEGPYTLSGRKMLTNTGFSNAVQLYEKREQDDAKALSEIGVLQKNLGFHDAVFRKKLKVSLLGKILPEFDHLYPTYSHHVVKRIAKDEYIHERIIGKLDSLVNKDTIVFIPFSVGNHADHKITRTVGETYFKNIIYYIDFPYNIRGNRVSFTSTHKEIIFSGNIERKIEILQHYTTEIKNLFDHGIVPKHTETFLIPDNYIV